MATEPTTVDQMSFTTISLWVKTHRKLSFIARKEGRTLVKQLDMLLDEVLSSGGFDPDAIGSTDESLDQEARRAS